MREALLRAVTSVEGLATRLGELNGVFNRANDRRGVFTAIYAPCVKALEGKLREGEFKDPATAERVVVALGKAYLEGLRPNGKRVAAVFGDQAALSALSRVFGFHQVTSTGMRVLLAEAFASSRLPAAALRAANHAKWSVREGLIGVL